MPAGMGGRNDVQVNSSYRGDRMCWLQPTHSSPALWAASEQILSLQKGECGRHGWMRPDVAAMSNILMILFVLEQIWRHGDMMLVGGRPYSSPCTQAMDLVMVRPCILAQNENCLQDRRTSMTAVVLTSSISLAERHTDASDSVPGRTVTAILYLNPGWDAALHGGQLCIYNLADRWRPGLKLDPQMSPGYAAGEPAVVVAPIGGRLVVFESNTAHEVLPAQVPRYISPQISLCNIGYASTCCTKPALDVDILMTGFSCRYALTVWFTKVKSSIAVPRALPDVDQLGSRIFVSMAAFRDPETRWTVNDLLTKAIYPARLRIGIVWQIDAAADTGFMDMPHSVDQNQVCLGDSCLQLRFMDLGNVKGNISVLHAHGNVCFSTTAMVCGQIRQIVIPATEATGPCKARMLAQKLWAGEEYYLQIDSHMRFVPGWDDQLVQWLAACEQQAQFGKAVLSTYPPSYEVCCTF